MKARGKRVRVVNILDNGDNVFDHLGSSELKEKVDEEDAASIKLSSGERRGRKTKSAEDNKALKNHYCSRTISPLQPPKVNVPSEKLKKYGDFVFRDVD